MEISQAITYYLTALENDKLSSHTLKAYRMDLEQFHQSLEQKDLDLLTFHDFQGYFSKLNSLSLKSSTLKRKRVVIKKFLKYCYQKKLCHTELESYISPIKSKKSMKPKEVLTHQEIDAIFNYLENEMNNSLQKKGSSYFDHLYYCAIRNKLIFSILLYTGCRAHEVVSIKKDDLDLSANTLTIFTKGNKYNILPIHENLLLVFESYFRDIKNCSEVYLNKIENSPYFFPGKDQSDKHISTRTLHDIMNKLSEVIGRHIHAHLLRHTFVSYCIASNMNISTISSLITHSDPSITLAIYTHEINALQKQKEIKKLNFHLET